MPPKPVVSTKTNEWKRYYICKRHLEKRKPKTENFIRTYGTCPCFITCRGTVHDDDSWTICVDKRGNGRCDHRQCNQFYLTGRCGFVDDDGKCYWADSLTPIRTAEGDHLRLAHNPTSTPAPAPVPKIATSHRKNPFYDDMWSTGTAS